MRRGNVAMGFRTHECRVPCLLHTHLLPMPFVDPGLDFRHQMIGQEGGASACACRAAVCVRVSCRIFVIDGWLFLDP